MNNSLPKFYEFAISTDGGVGLGIMPLPHAQGALQKHLVEYINDGYDVAYHGKLDGEEYVRLVRDKHAIVLTIQEFVDGDDGEKEEEFRVRLQNHVEAAEDNAPQAPRLYRVVLVINGEIVEQLNGMSYSPAFSTWHMRIDAYLHEGWSITTMPQQTHGKEFLWATLQRGQEHLEVSLEPE
jgi:hypothetical protein